MSYKPITLALGGGGARGISHLGVIDGLGDAKFHIGRVVGVSIGSLAGAMYAFNPDIKKTIGKALGYLLSDTFQKHQETLFGARRDSDENTGGVFSWYSQVMRYLRANRTWHRAVTRPSLLPSAIMQDVVTNLLPDADIADAKIPLSILAVDLHSGHQVVLERGSVREAVRASAAIPGIFPPVKWNQMLLADLGTFCSLPTVIAQSYGNGLVVGVDVSSRVKHLANCDTALDVLMRMDEIGEALFRKHVTAAADFIIRPPVSHTEWFDFSHPEMLINQGRKAARQHSSELAALLNLNGVSPKPSLTERIAAVPSALNYSI
jgi:NTE family protein